MSKSRKYIIVALLCLSGYPLFAQETLTGLSENPCSQPQPVRARRQSSYNNTPASINLPFIDDFAMSPVWPNPDLWTTNGVYVNKHYALNTPTIGVATFDALDSHGRLYPHLGNATAPADTLTSLPVNLTGENMPVLSFFYQPGGLGDIPGTTDKLSLEFYSPDSGNWTEVWSAVANALDSTLTEYRNMDNNTLVHRFDTLYTQFVYTALEIAPTWRRDGFRFRFINYVSLTVNLDAPGRANNTDLWHVDFVYLHAGRDVNNTALPDVGMAQLQAPLTSDYSSIPAYHLNSSAAQAIFSGNMRFKTCYRNLGWGTRNITRRFSIKPLYGAGANSQIINYSGGAENIFDGELHIREYEFEPYPFTAIGDAAAFEISSHIVIDVDTSPLRTALRHNDTTKYIQEFHDYYAYDDGSAENGYGLLGYGTSNGQVAVQFKPLMTDSLRGVYMYFHLAKDSANIKPFELAVWNDNDGAPGQLLLRQKVEHPALRNSLNAYVAYKFEKPLAIARNQVFYVGWIQSSEVFLNIGFDANNPKKGKNFYALSTTGDWYESIYNGALMIRPIFCEAAKFPTEYVPPPPALPATALPEEYLIYPNPATDRITIQDTNYEKQSLHTPRQYIEMFDMSGRKCRSGYTEGSMFSVSGLMPGIYILRVIEDGILKTTQKIIVH